MVLPQRGLRLKIHPQQQVLEARVVAEGVRYGSNPVRRTMSLKRGSERRVSALDAGLELIGIPFLFHFFQFHLHRFDAFVKFARQEIIRVRLRKLL